MRLFKKKFVILETKLPSFENINKIYDKVVKIIDSCKTFEQTMTAYNVVQNFKFSESDIEFFRNPRTILFRKVIDKQAELSKN